MGQIGPKLHHGEGGRITFWCPGCEEPHAITARGKGWTFDGNLERPTFSPSVLVTVGHYMPGWKESDSCWCTYNKKLIEEDKETSHFKCNRCHSFVTDGKIQFLDDSTHALAGQTVDLPDLPEHMQD